MTPELITLFANAGIAGVLAAVVIVWYRADSKERLDDEKQRTLREREDKIAMMEVIRQNSAALSEIITLVRRMGRQTGNDDYKRE